MIPWAIAHQAPLSVRFSGKNTGVGSHFFLQGIFLTQGLNPGLLHCRQILYHLSHQGSHIFVIDVIERKFKKMISLRKNNGNNTFYTVLYSLKGLYIVCLIPQCLVAELFYWRFSYIYEGVSMETDSGGTSGKEPTCQCQRHKRCGFDPWVGKIPWRGMATHSSILA